MCGLIVFCIAIGIIMTHIRSDESNDQCENVHKVIEFFNILMLGKLTGGSMIPSFKKTTTVLYSTVRFMF